MIHINFYWTGSPKGGLDINIPEWDQYQITKIEFALGNIYMYNEFFQSMEHIPAYNVIQFAGTDYWPFALGNLTYIENSSVKITTKGNYTFAWQVNGI